MTLFTAIKNVARDDPDRVALYGADSRLTYYELNRDIRILARRLRQENISRLALMLDNGLAWAVVDLACMLADVVMIPLPVFFSPEQQAWVLASSGADALIGPPREGWEATPILNLPLQRIRPALTPDLPAGTAKITYTSGSTGNPKGVCLSLDHMMRVGAALAERAAPAGAQRHLTLLPLSTLLENISGLYVPLMMGAGSHILPLADVGFSGSSQMSADTFAAALLKWQPHSLVLVPELLRILVALTDGNAALAAPLRFVAVGGGKVAPDLVNQANRLGIPVYEGYGLSECGSVVALNAPGQMKTGSVGRPLPHCRISVAGDGEIAVAGSGMLGYLGEPAASETIATGDVGYVDEDGFLYITGRKKNVQITAFGRNFSPEWVEAEAQLYPAIARMVVFGEGLPANVAIIQPMPGAEKDIAPQLDALNLGLPDYARIRHVIIAELNSGNGLLTPNGRPKRQRILDTYWLRINDFIKGYTL